MKTTKEEFKVLMRLFINGHLSRDAIVIPLQCYIQEHGFLDENDPLEGEFSRKFKEKDVE